ncbi:MAG: homoserine kinase [Erysipelotrichaceae bacterium]|nr:homoserine kinase [Erysipelotrichaceae bacterium]
MIKYKVPATSANLGIGFDCLGIALSLYDEFKVEESDKWELHGFINDEDVENNLFIHSYKEAAEYKQMEAKPLRVFVKDNVPCSRGLGSSSCLIVGGIYAFSALNNNCLSKEEMLEIATKIEGHPDNVAPAIFGGLCVANKDGLLKLKVSNKWNFGVCIFNYEVKTSEARKVLKDEIKRSDAVANISNAIMAVDALVNFNVENIKAITKDTIHEPYRKKLIKDFETCEKLAYGLGSKAFIISGSGSTCLSISDKPIDIKYPNMIYKQLKVDARGVR